MKNIFKFFFTLVVCVAGVYTIFAIMYFAYCGKFLGALGDGIAFFGFFLFIAITAVNIYLGDQTDFYE